MDLWDSYHPSRVASHTVTGIISDIRCLFACKHDVNGRLMKVYVITMMISLSITFWFMLLFPSNTYNRKWNENTRLYPERWKVYTNIEIYDSLGHLIYEPDANTVQTEIIRILTFWWCHQSSFHVQNILQYRLYFYIQFNKEHKLHQCRVMVTTNENAIIW